MRRSKRGRGAVAAVILAAGFVLAACGSSGGADAPRSASGRAPSGASYRFAVRDVGTRICEYLHVDQRAGGSYATDNCQPAAPRRSPMGEWHLDCKAGDLFVFG